MMRVIRHSLRRVVGACSLLACTLACALAPASAQTIGLNAGSSPSVIVPPNGLLTVPVIIDLSSAGALNIASLQSGMNWGSARLSLDSIRVVPAVGWSFTPNTTNAPSGSLLFNAFGASALGGTSTLANAYFRASATTGGTRVVLAPSGAANQSGQTVLAALRPRSLDVCVDVLVRWGDVNDDGLVNVADAQQIGRFAVGLSVTNPTALAQRGDVTADGVVNITDAQQIARFSVGLSASPRVNTEFLYLPPTTAVTTTPASAQTLVVGSSRQLSAAPMAGGTDLSGCTPIVWSSSNNAVATVNSTGFVTGLTAGSATITASNGGFSGQVGVTVTGVPVASVTVTLASPGVQVGSTTTATAVTRDASNNILTGRPVTFTSSNTAVATVNSTTGVVTGVAAGTATIFATSEGVTGAATVTVTTGVPVATVTVTLGAATINVGATTTATAVTRSATNTILTGRVVTWTSSNPGVATVNSSTGVVTGIAGGTANIIGTSEGVSGQATVTVAVVPVATVSVALGASTIFFGTTTQATATARDAGNNVLTGRVVTWSSSNTAIAAVNATTGVVTGIAGGTATIFATVEGITGSATITVTTAAPVASVSVALTPTGAEVGGTTTGSATLRDASNNVLSGREIVWSSSNTSVATVNSTTGVVTAVTTGTVNIRATSEGVTGQRSLTVSVAPVATVTVGLASSAITVGSTTTATAATFDANGNVLTGRSVTWSSSNTAVATVNSTGTVTGVAAGTANIIATSEGRTGQASIAVGVVPVASITVALSPSSIATGATSTATATLRDASNNVLTGRSVTWSSSNTARATVNSSTGVVTGVSTGTANIVATAEGVTGQATITVATAAVASVTVSLGASSIAVGGTTTATAVLRDASNNVLTGRTVTWSSSNTAAATVNSSTGAVSGVAAGTANIVATSEGVTGSAGITVGTPTSNEPSGMTILVNRNWSCNIGTGCDSGWAYSSTMDKNTQVVTDAAAPKSPSTVTQMNYPAGFAAGSGPAVAERGFGGQRTTLYISQYVKYSSNWQGHSSGVNKITYFYGAGFVPYVYTLARGSGSGTLLSSIALQRLAAAYSDGRGTTGTEVFLDPNTGAAGHVIRGQWHHYEYILEMNTAGVSNGRIQAWLDGVKTHDWSGIRFVGSGGSAWWELLHWAPVWGGTGGTVSATMFQQMDHLYVSGK